MHPIDARQHSYFNLTILTSDCYTNPYVLLSTTRASTRAELHSKRFKKPLLTPRLKQRPAESDLFSSETLEANRLAEEVRVLELVHLAPSARGHSISKASTTGSEQVALGESMPIISYHSTLIASRGDISHAQAYFSSSAEGITSYVRRAADDAAAGHLQSNSPAATTTVTPTLLPVHAVYGIAKSEGELGTYSIPPHAAPQLKGPQKSPQEPNNQYPAAFAAKFCAAALDEDLNLDPLVEQFEGEAIVETGEEPPAEPAQNQKVDKTTSHILLSRGVKDDPSLPPSSHTSPTIAAGTETDDQRSDSQGRKFEAVDFAVTTVWDNTGNKVMTFGVAGAVGRNSVVLPASSRLSTPESPGLGTKAGNDGEGKAYEGYVSGVEAAGEVGGFGIDGGRKRSSSTLQREIGAKRVRGDAGGVADIPTSTPSPNSSSRVPEGHPGGEALFAETKFAHDVAEAGRSLDAEDARYQLEVKKGRSSALYAVDPRSTPGIRSTRASLIPSPRRYSLQSEGSTLSGPSGKASVLLGMSPRGSKRGSRTKSMQDALQQNSIDSHGDLSVDDDVPDLPNMPSPITSRKVANLEDATSTMSYVSLESNNSGWSSFSGIDELDDPLPRRGRSLIRKDRVPNPFSRASSRNRMSDAAIEVNVRFMEPRLRRSSTFHDDPEDIPARLEDRLIEPLPRGSINTSFYEVLNDIETRAGKYQKRYSETALEMAFTFVEETTRAASRALSPAGMSRNHSPASRKGSSMSAALRSHRASSGTTREELLEIIARTERELGAYSETPSYPNILANIQPKEKGKQPQRRKSVVALKVPAEILHHIYLYLGPVDFDAARHVCRLWYINSLEYSLLDTMLRRGGWSTSMWRELAANRGVDKSVRVNEEWLMSKHLARECALGPDWRGNGIIMTEADTAVGVNLEHRTTPFRLCSKLDFRSAGVNYTTDEMETCGMLFTVSNCSKFLMVSQGTIVYIYELNRSHRTHRGHDRAEDGALRPFTSIICPRRVLACSMDTSSNRDAIAILMDGRMGLVCAVTGNSNRSGRATHMRDLRKMQEQSDVFPVSRGGSWRNNVSLGTSHSPRMGPVGSDHRLHVSVLVPDQTPSLEGDSTTPNEGSDVELDHHYAPPKRNSGLNFPKLVQSSYPMPIEASPPTLYALLCSADDPPRSVALCPQRRCVAFGCSSGIELHWVDALTGQDLNRWFPLTAPSDYLYFLPPRAGVDSAKKLRLVSSKGTPGEKATMSERFSSRKKHSAFWGVHSSQGLFGGDDAGHGQQTQGRRGASDHYRAVPLSDGYHLLFTDPASGVLCLGNDAPLGGPTKLLRKLWFSGPVAEGSPISYAAASDLRWGVRVVAAYGLGREQSIYLFSVPADVLADGHGRGEVTMGTQGNGQLITAHAFRKESIAKERNGPKPPEWQAWWGANAPGVGAMAFPQPGIGFGSGVGGGAGGIHWPIQIRGQEVRKCRDLVDLAIHSGPEIGITVWAFSRGGVAHTWSIDNISEGVKQRWVVRDGTVREGDGDGDMEMCEADVVFPESSPWEEWEDGTPSSPNYNEQERGLRGNASASYDGALLSPESGSPERRDSVPGLEVVMDVDGDVLMADLGDLGAAEEAGVQHRREELFERSWRGENEREWDRRWNGFGMEDFELGNIRPFATSSSSYASYHASRIDVRDDRSFGYERGVYDRGRGWDDAVESVDGGEVGVEEMSVQMGRYRWGRERRNEVGQAREGMDLVEELTGVARIDIEIR